MMMMMNPPAHVFSDQDARSFQHVCPDHQWSSQHHHDIFFGNSLLLDLDDFEPVEDRFFVIIMLESHNQWRPPSHLIIMVMVMIRWWWWDMICARSEQSILLLTFQTIWLLSAHLWFGWSQPENVDQHHLPAIEHHISRPILRFFLLLSFSFPQPVLDHLRTPSLVRTMSAMMFAKDSMHSPIMIELDQNKWIWLWRARWLWWQQWWRRCTLLNRETMDENIVPAISGHLLNLGVHLKHLQVVGNGCLHHHRKEDHDQESHLAPNILDLCSETCNLANRVGDFSSRQVLNNLCLIFDTLWYSSVAWQERKRFWRHHQNLFRNPILKRVNHLIQFSKTLLQIGLEVSSASFQV